MKDLRKIVLFTPLVIFVSLIIVGIIDAVTFVNVLTGWFETIMVNFGWIICFMVTAFIIFLLTILFHPIGLIKIGGEDAKPTMSYWQWFAISLCGGIGTGIMFWAAVEPLVFTFEPAPSLGLVPGSNEAILWAMRTTFLHWTFTPYAMYMLFGVVLAFAVYNLKLSPHVSSGFYLLMGKKALKPRFATIIDTITAFALIGGVAGSLGWGLLQLDEGIEMLFGIGGTNTSVIAICVTIVVAYTLTSISGLHKGVAWLSDKNAKIFLVLMVFFFLLGPTAYICNLMTESVGSYFNYFVQDTFVTAPFKDGENWPQWWNMFWWLDFLSYGPLMGLLYARLSYGRTIREAVLMHWVVPAVFSIIWFSIFGGTVLDAQFNGVDFYALYQEKGMQVLMLAAFDLLPLAFILKPVALIVIALSFITLADTMVTTLASLSMRDGDVEDTKNEAPVFVKVIWAVLIGGASLIFTLTGGIDGLKMVKTFAGLPIVIIGIAMLIGFIKYFWNHAGRGRFPEVQDYYQMRIDEEAAEEAAEAAGKN